MVNENYIEYIEKYLINPTAINLNYCVEALLNAGFELQITLQKNECVCILKKDCKYLFFTKAKDLKNIYINIIKYLHELNNKYKNLVIIIYNIYELNKLIDKIQNLNKEMFKHYFDGTCCFPILIWDIGIESCQHKCLHNITDIDTWKKMEELMKKAKKIDQLEEDKK